MAGTFVPEDQVPTTEEPAPAAQQGQAGNFVPEASVPEGGTGGGQPTESLDVLPFSRYPRQGWRFDPNAGLLGAATSAFTLPAEVLHGQATMADPATQQRATQAASFVTPDLQEMSAARSTVPDFNRILSIGGSGYDVARGMGVNYRVPAVQNMVTALKQKLYGMGIRDTDAPKTFAKIDDLMKTPQGAYAVPLDGLESFRRGFSGLSTNPDRQEATAASVMTRGIDDFYANPTPTTVHSGPADRAAAILKDARANVAAGKRSEMLATEQAGIEQQSEKPGSDYANMLQSRLRWLSDPRWSNKRLPGFNDQEVDAIAKASKPGAGQYLIGQANKLLGERGILALAGERLGETGGIPGRLVGLAAGSVIPPMISSGLERLNRGIANRAFSNVDELVRSRAPLAQQEQQALPSFNKVLPDARRAPPAIRALRVLGPAAARQAQGDLSPVQINRPIIPATQGAATPMPQLYD